MNSPLSCSPTVPGWRRCLLRRLARREITQASLVMKPRLSPPSPAPLGSLTRQMRTCPRGTSISARTLYTKRRCVATGTKSVTAAMVVRANLLMARRSFVLSLAMASGRPKPAWPGFTEVALTAVGAAMHVSGQPPEYIYLLAGFR